MKNIFLLSVATLLITSCKKEPVDPSIYGNTITSEELKTLLYKYASDEFEGRETGEPGHDLAVEYLKGKYLSMNIASAYNTDDYFQEVPLEKRKLSDANVTINGKQAIIYDDYIPPRNVNISNLDIKEVVYAGYGIDTDNYSDYKNLDVKNKIVVIKSGEPMSTDSIYITTGTKEKSQWTSGRQARRLKLKTAEDHGAKGVFILDQLAHNYYSKAYKRIDPETYEGRISSAANDDEFYYFMVDTGLAKQIVPDIETNNTPQQVVETDIKLSIKKNVDAFNSHNVVALIKGEEKPEEIVVISAHLDHNGVNDDGKVYNGADDDGSGTVAMLEIAQAFKAAIKDGYRPKRSILFLHFTAEEKGLQGSKHYTDIDPIFPLENTVANLNIDMIGRVDKHHEDDKNYVYVIGADMLSSELYDINETANKKYTNINLDYRYSNETDPNRYYYRSDHYNFAKHNIPVAFYFNGPHEDYHRVSDTPDKIEYDLLENRARLVFYTAWDLVNRDNRIVVDKTKKTEE